jgi:hypothetical protein
MTSIVSWPADIVHRLCREPMAQSIAMRRAVTLTSNGSQIINKLAGLLALGECSNIDRHAILSPKSENAQEAI